MLQQKIARLASDFASQLIGVLTAAPLQELAELERPSTRTPAVKRVVEKVEKKVATKKVATRKTASARGREPTAAVTPTPAVKAAALDFFAERGSKGATAHQVGAYLTEIGLASTLDVVGALATAGAIRDAGFRRAAGKNATATVYIAS